MGVTFKDKDGREVHFGKFNPYHDARGRFSTANGSTSFTYAPGKSKAHDNAIAREKARAEAEAKNNDGSKRIAAAESQLKSMLRDGAEVKLEGMDPELAESTVKSVKMVLDRYPGMKDAFGGFTTDDAGDTFTANNGVMACYAGATQKIHFNKEYFSDAAQFKQRYDESVKKQFHPEGTTHESVVVHEMGHAIDRYVSLKVIGTTRVVWGGESVSSRLWNNDIKNGKKKGTPMTGKSIRDALSGYAGKNPKEYIAEGLAEYLTSPNPRALAKSIGKRMDTYIKKAGGM